MFTTIKKRLKKSFTDLSLFQMSLLSTLSMSALGVLAWQLINPKKTITQTTVTFVTESTLFSEQKYNTINTIESVEPIDALKLVTDNLNTALGLAVALSAEHPIATGIILCTTGATFLLRHNIGHLMAKVDSKTSLEFDLPSSKVKIHKQ